VRTKL